jgi:hypothetical protein
MPVIYHFVCLPEVSREPKRFLGGIRKTGPSICG